MDGVRSVFPARGRIYRYTCGLASESDSGIAPGDTLTLLPGVYRQGTVAIRCRGTQESPIVIQGKDRENTLVTAWKSLDTGHMGACSRKTVCLPCRLGRRYIRHFRSGKQAEHDAGAGSG